MAIGYDSVALHQRMQSLTDSSSQRCKTCDSACYASTYDKCKGLSGSDYSACTAGAPAAYKKCSEGCYNTQATYQTNSICALEQEANRARASRAKAAFGATLSKCDLSTQSGQCLGLAPTVVHFPPLGDSVTCSTYTWVNYYSDVNCFFPKSVTSDTMADCLADNILKTYCNPNAENPWSTCQKACMQNGTC